MNLHSITLLLVSFFTFSLALPGTTADLTRPVTPGGELHKVTLNINRTSGIIERDPATGWCNFNLGLIEHFPRGGSTGGRKASVKIGGMWDAKSKPIRGYTWDNGDPPLTERRIDNWTIRVYDLIHRGDSLSFTWFHPDNNNPAYEWLDFNYNGAKWNDRDTNCKREGVKNCCKRGPWYSDGKDRMISGVDCGFSCP
ncbi:hypothetical protein EJ07DRAFT_179829 [Lizonia empirigonia]|nr:hypothetical protein EJ07DRAFT_179829 [Lizonia empirigonia]